MNVRSFSDALYGSYCPLLSFAVEHGSRPRTYAIKLRDEDEGGRGRLAVRRLNSSGVSCTRSLEHLDRLEPESKFTDCAQSP